MKITALYIGMKIRHPQYGLGTIKALNEVTADISFDDGVKRTVAPDAVDLEPADPSATITGLGVPLPQFIEQTVEVVVNKLGVEKADSSAHKLGTRWHKGKIVMHPADPTLQTKEVDLETFFHKIVMVRNNLRVLEQKINAHPQLSEADKIEMQQYITKSYGSFTTFNVLFKEKEDQF